MAFARIIAVGAVLLALTPPVNANHDPFDPFTISAETRGPDTVNGAPVVRKIGTFPYDRHLTQFHPTVGWTDGDRHAYWCAFAFLQRNTHDPNSEILGRVTFISFGSGFDGYAWINSGGMFTSYPGIRHYNDGALVTPENPLPPDYKTQCAQPSGYPPLEGPAQPRPVVRFQLLSSSSPPQDVEVRDYNNINPHPAMTFRIRSSTAQRVEVVVYRDAVPVMVVYYDSLSPNVRMVSNA